MKRRYADGGAIPPVMTVPDKRGITFGYEASLNPRANDAPASSDVLIPQPRFQSPTSVPRTGNEINQQTSNFAKGGKVRGSGCEQRGLRKCKVV